MCWAFFLKTSCKTIIPTRFKICCATAQRMRYAQEKSVLSSPGPINTCGCDGDHSPHFIGFVLSKSVSRGQTATTCRVLSNHVVQSLKTHCTKTTLITCVHYRFLAGGEDVVLKAPPPPHFLWTCERLGLKRPEQARIAAV